MLWLHLWKTLWNVCICLLDNVHYSIVCGKTQPVFTENSQKFFPEQIGHGQ